MEYPKSFISLMHRLSASSDPNLKFVGLGNPYAKILILEKECVIRRDSTRGEWCYEMEHTHNINQWQKNISNSTNPDNVPDWITSPIGEEYYNPLYPYKGLKNVKAIREDNGSLLNNGVSSSWLAYQKLIDHIYEKECTPIAVDFHQHAFLSNFIENKEQWELSLKTRCSKLFNSTFFDSFPVVVVNCGINEYPLNEDKERLVIHTKRLSGCTYEEIESLAERIRLHLYSPLLKHCMY